MAAFFTKARLESSIESLDDLNDQYLVRYAPIKNSDEMFFFKRMRDIEQMFYNHWKNVSLDDTLTAFERAKYAIWEYPVSTKYTKLWEAMEKTTFPDSTEDAIKLVESSTAISGFAFLGDATDINYLAKKNCQFLVIGEEFSRKPYAIGIQQGSPLKNELDEILLTLLSTRWLENRKKYWWPNTTCGLEAEFDGIHVTHIYGFFIVIVSGILMSMIALAIEYFWFKHRATKSLGLNVVHVAPINAIENIDEGKHSRVNSNCRNRNKNVKRRISQVLF